MPAVDSTCVSSISYEPMSKTLTVTFKQSGRTYNYHGVPLDVYKGFIAAFSKGKYFNYLIKRNYAFS